MSRETGAGLTSSSQLMQAEAAPIVFVNHALPVQRGSVK